jgi:hypothetical protein
VRQPGLGWGLLRLVRWLVLVRLAQQLALMQRARWLVQPV